EFFILQGGRMSRSGLRRLMVLCASGTRLARTEMECRPTQQMEIQANYLAEYEQVSTLAYSLN
ncbi:hypothetical protein KQI69_06295, partial [Eubacterium sp. MSJ-13]|uniref:hypothetical protein n=1 Tax=Eubacterium sp. MSJ-13 TaxID=2841513 RepID=UPI001C1202A7